MITHKRQFAVLISMVCTLAFSVPAAFAQETTATDAATPTTTSAIPLTTQSLNAENVQSLKIVPVHESRNADNLLLQDAITPNTNGEFVLHRQTTIGLEPMQLFGSSEQHDIVQISGHTEPFAFVTLKMVSEHPRTEVTRANQRGQWEIRVSVDYLPAGEHLAYIQTDLNGVKSDELEVAKFVVVARDTVSNSTWMFIALIALAIILLLIASTLQIRQNRRMMDEQAPSPVIPEGKRVNKKPSAKK